MLNRGTQRLCAYVGTLFGSALLVGALCFAINVLVDPLWYLRGNLISGVNYAFNERTAKMIRLLPQMTSYDCVLIGSSHTALMHERLIRTHRCFNLGFSHGRVGEFLSYAKYLRARGFRPRLVVINVDLYDFEERPDALTIPDFIRNGEDPPSILRTYLSLDALNFSLRTLRGSFPNHLVYSRDGEMHIIAKTHPYRPPQVAPRSNPPPFHSELASSFAELREIFPEARAIGWVPPISAWTIAQLKLDGRLAAYLNTLAAVASGFDEFLDFGIPSGITAETSNTFDGMHYVDSVNDRVVIALISGAPAFGIDWHQWSLSAMTVQYVERLDEFVFHTRTTISSELGNRGVVRLAADNGPHFSGTNPYATAIVHLRADPTPMEKEQLVARIESLQQKYGFSWDGSFFQDQVRNPSPGSDYFTIRISLHRSDIPALSREPDVTKVESISAYAF
jgi:hypothetical protein